MFVHKMNHELEAALTVNPRQVDALLVQMMFCSKAPAIVGGNRQRALSIADNIVSFLPSWGYLAHARLLVGKGEDAQQESYLKKAAQADAGMVRPRRVPSANVPANAASAQNTTMTPLLT